MRGGLHVALALRRVLLGILVLSLGTLLTACDLRRLQIVIPDFESSSVQGVEVWRIAEGTNQPVQAGVILFSGVHLLAGKEVIDYVNQGPDGSDGVGASAELVRDAANPDVVQVQLYFDLRTTTGWYKISTFNGNGSSPLSLAQTYL
jgi:hypothetical protein